MRVIVTGNNGKIGRIVCRLLGNRGHDVVGFDLAAGEDVLDIAALAAKADRCQAIVHLAARTDDDAPDLMATNLLGTWNVLGTARSLGIPRVVFMSSVNALGIFSGHRPPDYLPIDDAHPSYAYRPYALSKRLGEQMCEALTSTADIATICLRPPGVLDSADYERIRTRRQEQPEYEWSPIWEYGAFLDVRDCASAVERALTVDFRGHATMLLCADDISATRPTLSMVEELLPDVEWRGSPDYQAEPFRALVDTSSARLLLGWRPTRRWRD